MEIKTTSNSGGLTSLHPFNINNSQIIFIFLSCTNSASSENETIPNCGGLTSLHPFKIKK